MFGTDSCLSKICFQKSKAKKKKKKVLEICYRKDATSETHTKIA
jgi:hypothetical protein